MGLLTTHVTSPIFIHRDFPMVKAAWEFDFYRCLAFDPKYYGITVSKLHSGNLRSPTNGRYSSLFPRDKVSYWAGDRETASAEVRKYGAKQGLITFHAYDDASSTFPTTDCNEPLIIIDGRDAGFTSVLDKQDRNEPLSIHDMELIEQITAVKPDCLMYESHVRKGGVNFLFFKKGFAKLSIKEVSLNIKRKEQKTGLIRTNRARITCAHSSDYCPDPKAYGKGFASIARTYMDDSYLNSEEYAKRSRTKWHEPYLF